MREAKLLLRETRFRGSVRAGAARASKETPAPLASANQVGDEGIERDVPPTIEADVRRGRQRQHVGATRGETEDYCLSATTLPSYVNLPS